MIAKTTECSLCGALATYRTITEYEYDIHKSIKKHKPKVVASFYVDIVQDKAIADYYEQSSRYGDLYIRIDNIQPEH